MEEHPRSLSSGWQQSCDGKCPSSWADSLSSMTWGCGGQAFSCFKPAPKASVQWKAGNGGHNPQGQSWWRGSSVGAEVTKTGRAPSWWHETSWPWTALWAVRGMAWGLPAPRGTWKSSEWESQWCPRLPCGLTPAPSIAASRRAAARWRTLCRHTEKG